MHRANKTPYRSSVGIIFSFLKSASRFRKFQYEIEVLREKFGLVYHFPSYLLRPRIRDDTPIAESQMKEFHSLIQKILVHARDTAIEEEKVKLENWKQNVLKAIEEDRATEQLQIEEENDNKIETNNNDNMNNKEKVK